MPAGRKRTTRRRTIGLALGAGGARGIAHVGVLRELTRAGIPIDAVVGTSVGALVGAVYAGGQLESFERLMRRFDWSDAARMFDPVWPRSGLLSGARVLERLGAVLGDWRIEDLPIPFGAVCVDLITGEEVLIREGRVIDAVRASISIPGIFVPHRIGSRLLVDGALRNPVPASALKEMGIDVRIAVNLHARPVREIVTPRKTGGSSKGPTVATRFVEAIDRRLARFRRQAKKGQVSDEPRGGPNLFEILSASMTVVEHELARHRLATDPVDVVLTPDVRGVRSFEFHKARQAIQAGLTEAERSLPEIRRVLRERARRKSPKTP